jgi:hypothetical protein
LEGALLAATEGGKALPPWEKFEGALVATEDGIAWCEADHDVVDASDELEGGLTATEEGIAS